MQSSRIEPIRSEHRFDPYVFWRRRYRTSFALAPEGSFGDLVLVSNRRTNYREGQSSDYCAVSMQGSGIRQTVLHYFSEYFGAPAIVGNAAVVGFPFFSRGGLAFPLSA
jgi:hypothetical protein